MKEAGQHVRLRLSSLSLSAIEGVCAMLRLLNHGRLRLSEVWRLKISMKHFERVPAFDNPNECLDERLEKHAEHEA